MKKILVIAVVLFTFLGFISCKEDESYSLIAPSGTPSLGIATYIKSHGESARIVNGQTELVQAFTSKSSDIIVAPINLGIKMFNQTGEYLLYSCFVWGNTFIASTSIIEDIYSLEGKTIICFGKDSSPDLLFKWVIDKYNINVETIYVADVNAANTLLLSGKADIILTAEPSLTMLKTKKLLYTLDLQKYYSDCEYSTFPQAGIFVKKSLIEKESFKNELKLLKESIETAILDPSLTSLDAVNISTSFESIGVDNLIKAIPNCNFALHENEKEYIEDYINKLIESMLGNQIGGKLPSEEFYLD